MNEPTKPIQFRIRTLLAVTAAVSIILGLVMAPENAKTLALLCASGTVVLVCALVQRRIWLAVAGCLIVAVAVPVHSAINRSTTRNPHIVTIAVSVMDAATSRGIPNARVYVEPFKAKGTETVTTDADGRANLAWDLDLFGAASRLVVSADGYEPTYKRLIDGDGKGLSEDRCDPPIVVTLEKQQTANTRQPQSPPSSGQPGG